MSKNILLHHQETVPLYFGRLHVVVANDLGEATKELGIAKGTDPDMASFGAVTTESESSGGVTQWWALFRPNAEVGEMAHEAKHLVNFIFVSRGLKLDAYHDEAECYLLGWVMSQVYNALKPKKKK